MAQIKLCTNLEQSKKLTEILPFDSADMYYFLDPTPAGNIYHLVVQRVDVGTKNLPQYDKGDIPCWSLAALLEILANLNCIWLGTDDVSAWRCVFNLGKGEHLETTEECINPIDACYKLIIHLHELKIL